MEAGHCAVKAKYLELTWSLCEHSPDFSVVIAIRDAKAVTSQLMAANGQVAHHPLQCGRI